MDKFFRQLSAMISRKKSFQAFTLIELLVVMMIIVILTLVSVANFGSAQYQAKLDYTTDSVVAILREQMQLARSGRVVGNELQCYGVRVSDGKLEIGQGKFEAVSVDKVNKCTINDADWKAFLSSDTGVGGVKLGVEVKIDDLTFYSALSDKKTLFFIPPYGKFKRDDSTMEINKFQFAISAGDGSGVIRYVCFSPEENFVGRQTALCQ